MSTTALTRSDQDQEQFSIIEQVVISGDLGKLQPQQRVDYYRKVCDSVGLNPFTSPFAYITLNGKLTLYAKKDATEQLRKLHGISITSLIGQFVDDLYIVTATAQSRDGRIDQATGAVSVQGLKGEAKANAIMKGETKAKRRVTLSMAGLGWLDESEAESIPGAQRVYVDQGTGEIVQPTQRQIEQQPEPVGHRAPQATQSAQVEPAVADDILSDKSLPEALLAFVGELRGQERPGAKRASEKQHQLGVSIIDGITGEQTHRQVFQSIFRREVVNTPDGRLGEDAFKLLMKHLSDKRTIKQGGEWVKIDNEDYSIEHANMIRVIHNWTMGARGQMTIDQTPDVQFESEGDRLFA